MILPDPILERLTTPKPGSLSTRLPNLHARKNAQLVAAIKAQEAEKRAGK